MSLFQQQEFRKFLFLYIAAISIMFRIMLMILTLVWNFFFFQISLFWKSLGIIEDLFDLKMVKKTNKPWVLASDLLFIKCTTLGKSLYYFRPQLFALKKRNWLRPCCSRLRSLASYVACKGSNAFEILYPSGPHIPMDQLNISALGQTSISQVQSTLVFLWWSEAMTGRLWLRNVFDFKNMEI